MAVLDLLVVAFDAVTGFFFLVVCFVPVKACLRFAAVWLLPKPRISDSVPSLR